MLFKTKADVPLHLFIMRIIYTVNEWGGVKGDILQALLDHLPYSGLREGSVVDLLRLLGG